MSRIILLVGLVLLGSSFLLGQPEPLGNEGLTNVPPTYDTPPFNPEFSPTRSSQEIYLSAGVLLFGLVVVMAQVLLLRQREEPISESMKYLSITLIIVGSLFLVTAGYGNTQIAPIIGLLGTVAGYLMGRQKLS